MNNSYSLCLDMFSRLSIDISMNTFLKLMYTQPTMNDNDYYEICQSKIFLRKAKFFCEEV